MKTKNFLWKIRKLLLNAYSYINFLLMGRFADSKKWSGKSRSVSSLVYSDPFTELFYTVEYIDKYLLISIHDLTTMY